MRIERVIACLDVADGKVVQGVGFRAHREVGEVSPSTERYVGQGVCGVRRACASVLVIGKALDEDRLHLAGARP